ncbi:MAG: NAD(P)/FAD-dependent oxidoreductase [Thermoanaerobaculia bacterium]
MRDYGVMEGPVVIVGAGAAGLMAARVAAGRGRPVVVLEAARDPGRKILISGGGRCNVLPGADGPARFISDSPNRLVRRFLARWPLEKQRVFFEELLGGTLREEPETGKLFPPMNRARDVRDALSAAVLAAGAEIRSASPVRDLLRSPRGGFEVLLDEGSVHAAAVVLATGGRSVLSGGADAAGFEWAASLGHTVRPLYPALVPLVGDAPAHHALAGVSLRARVTAISGEESAVSEGGFLFTHKGWSGPAVLDVSHVVERAGRAGRALKVRVTFLPTELEGKREEYASNGPEQSASAFRFGSIEAIASTWEERLRTGARSGGSLSSFLRNSSLPDRLASLVLETAGVPDVSLSRLPREARKRVVSALAAFPIPATGTEGYRTAEVTGGGVALGEVDPGSGESRLVPGLFFAGEILDAFGPIGGFNFQWAWATGRTAGEAAARRLTP